MEEYAKNQKDEEEMEKAELNKKVLNYKSEYQEILNKFKEMQDNYINRKTENALMENQNENDLVDDDDTKDKTKNEKAAAGAGDPYKVDGELDNNKKKNNKYNKKESANMHINNNNNKLKNNTQNIKNSKVVNEISLISVANNDNSIIENHNANVMGYALNPNKDREEPFHEINVDYDKRKKKTIFLCIIICIIIFILIVLIALLSHKK